MKKKIDINKLYFGVKLFPISYTSKSERNKLKTYNLFEFGRVKGSVAKYVTMTDKEKKSILSDPLHFCFGDVRSRAEFEFTACPWPYTDEMSISNSGVKVDTWSLYVEPNADYLMSLVNSVSPTSAKAYLRDERKGKKGLL